MTHAFAKDSRACAACVSWSGERMLAADNTLVQVPRYSVEGECRTAISQDYRRIRKSYHTCDAWMPLPLLRAHGGRTDRTPGPSAAMSAILAQAPAPGAQPNPPPNPPNPPPAPAVAQAPTPVHAPAAPPRPAAAPQPTAAPRPATPYPTTPHAPAPRPAVRPAPPPPPPPEPPPALPASTPLDIDKVPPPARVLHAYWTRLKGAERLPAARALDTARLRDCVPRLVLLEPVRGGADFLYRSCGKAVQRRLGSRPVSRLVTDVHPADAAERWLADLRACLEEVEPRSLLVRDDPLLPGQKFVELLLPLADERGRPAFVLAYRHLPGA